MSVEFDADDSEGRGNPEVPYGGDHEADAWMFSEVRATGRVMMNWCFKGFHGLRDSTGT